ncbi:hypothetical protein T06_10861 [Trichinella sp. T6]|nr:hypothetical protein T06_10861 [Trichinella sp. T6]
MGLGTLYGGITLFILSTFTSSGCQPCKILLYLQIPFLTHGTDGYLCTHVWLSRPVVLCFQNTAIARQQYQFNELPHLLRILK